MRLIDADKVIEILDDIDGFTFFAPESVKELLDDVPTVEPKLYGFDVRQLAVAATLLQQGKVTPEKLAETMTNVKKLMGFLLEDLQGIVQSSLANIYKEEPDERVGDLFMRSYGRGIDRECRVDRDPGD